MAGTMDKMQETAHNTLFEFEDNPEKRQSMQAAWARRKSMLEELKKNSQFILELLICRHVDNFLNFLSEILFEIFVQRPETLRSTDKVELSEVLRHKTLEDFVRAAAERRVDQLAYQSFGDLRAFFIERFKLELVTDISAAIEAIELRNISTHNRCIINNRYCVRTGSDTSNIGKTRDIVLKDLEAVSALFATAARNIDKAARQKLHLKATRFDINAK
jgi:hypothetical protein